MQDCYVGDIGDYGKYGLLREICVAGISLSVNWYRVVPNKMGKQDDGKYVNYLLTPELYKEYDPFLFDALNKIVLSEQDRRIKRIEEERLFRASFFSCELSEDRDGWHRQALEQTAGADVVFLDPDNGLESVSMHQKNSAKSKHVKWSELKDYYDRGQSVILYQHRPQMMTKKKCIEGIMRFQNEYLLADYVKLLEFPKYTNRFYFMFLHKRDKAIIERVCRSVVQKWSKNDFCHEIILRKVE